LEGGEKSLSSSRRGAAEASVLGRFKENGEKRTVFAVNKKQDIKPKGRGECTKREGENRGGSVSRFSVVRVLLRKKRRGKSREKARNGLAIPSQKEERT